MIDKFLAPESYYSFNQKVKTDEFKHYFHNAIKLFLKPKALLFIIVDLKQNKISLVFLVKF